MANFVMAAGSVVEVLAGGAWKAHTLREAVSFAGDVRGGWCEISHKGYAVRAVPPVSGGSGLLDSIVAAQSGRGAGPVVLSESHDVSKINWVRGMSDPGEMIGCGMYQQLRRLDAESDSDYAARLAVVLLTIPADDRQRIESAMIAAAQKRAGLDVSTGRVAVMVAGAAARRAWWHTLGVSVRDAVSGLEALNLSSTNFGIKKLAATWRGPDGVVRESEETFVLVRDDTGAEVGSAGTGYKVISPRDGVEFLDALQRDGLGKFVTAGAINGGKQTWVQMELGGRLELPGGDVTTNCATFLADHRGRSGGGSDYCFSTGERVVCANTLSLALGKDRANGVKIRHTGDVRAKLGDARKAFGLAAESFQNYRQFAEASYRASVDIQAVGAVVLDSLVALKTADLGKSDEAVAAERLEAIIDLAAPEYSDRLEKATGEVRRERAKRGGILADILERYESETCKPRGSGWGVFQAVNESAVHGKWGKELNDDNRESRRLESVLYGDRNDASQLALATVAAAVGGPSVA